jgi:hypothetical protein
MAKQTGIKISLTTFLEFVNASGMSKVNKVKTAIAQYEEYKQSRDYYKYLRDAITECIQKGEDPKNIRKVIEKVPNNRHQNYGVLIESFIKWHKKANPVFASVKCRLWEFQNLEILINPEINVRISNVPYAIKIWFKQDEITNNRITLINH